MQNLRFYRAKQPLLERSLTETSELGKGFVFLSQCTYRCVVLPDKTCYRSIISDLRVSMHLQVRGAP